MRSTQLFVFLLVVGVANAQFSGIISGLVEGLVEGGMKGTVGSFYPIVKDGMSTMMQMGQSLMSNIMSMMQSIMSMAPQLFSTLSNVFGGIFSTGTNLMNGFTGLGKLQMKQITTSAQHGLIGTFHTFGTLNRKDQQSIVGTVEKASKVMLAVTKLRINSLKNADKEVLAMRKVMESEHKSPQQLLAALKKQAPKLSEFAQTVVSKGLAEFRANKQKLGQSAQKGLTMMVDSLHLSQKGIENVLGKMNTGAKKEFGPMFHLMSNTAHVVNAAI